jgi:hypothetical protein
VLTVAVCRHEELMDPGGDAVAARMLRLEASC